MDSGSQEDSWQWVPERGWKSTAWRIRNLLNKAGSQSPKSPMISPIQVEPGTAPRGIWRPIKGDERGGGAWMGGSSGLYKKTVNPSFWKNTQMLRRSVGGGWYGHKVLTHKCEPHSISSSNASEMHLLKWRTGFCSGGLSFRRRHCFKAYWESDHFLTSLRLGPRSKWPSPLAWNFAIVFLTLSLPHLSLTSFYFHCRQKDSATS